MAGPSSSKNSCQHKNRKSAVRAHRQKCWACKDFIYAGKKSALFCSDCENFFHDFCLENEDVKFIIAGRDEEIELVRTEVESIAPEERCDACEDPLTGLTRYTNGEYSVHPECAVNLVSCQIIGIKAQRVNCMIGEKVNNYNWSYPDTEKSGCHLHCLREKMIKGDDTSKKHKDMNRNKYFETVGTPNGRSEKVIRGAGMAVRAVASLAQLPGSGLIGEVVKCGEEKAVQRLYDYKKK